MTPNEASGEVIHSGIMDSTFKVVLRYLVQKNLEEGWRIKLASVRRVVHFPKSTSPRNKRRNCTDDKASETSPLSVPELSRAPSYNEITTSSKHSRQKLVQGETD